MTLLEFMAFFVWGWIIVLAISAPVCPHDTYLVVQFSHFELLHPSQSWVCVQAVVP